MYLKAFVIKLISTFGGRAQLWECNIIMMNCQIDWDQDLLGMIINTMSIQFGEIGYFSKHLTHFGVFTQGPNLKRKNMSNMDVSVNANLDNIESDFSNEFRL